MIGRSVAVAIAVAGSWAWASGAVRAERFTSGDHQFEVDVPDDWSVVQPDAPYTADRPGLVAAWSRREAPDAVVARMDEPGIRAWRGDDSFFTSFERGLAGGREGYHRISSRKHKLGRVPALDLWFRDAHGVVGMRVLFFRRYMLSFAIALDADDYRKQRRATRKVLDSFRPYFGD